MANENLVTALIEKSSEVYTKLRNASDSTLSRQQVLEIIGPDYEPYYSNVVQGLAALKLVVRSRGYYGGVSPVPSGESTAPELTAEQRTYLSEHFDPKEMQPTTKIEKAASGAEEQKLEKEFYDPLKDYLEKAGLYEIVNVSANLGGFKWENADLAAISFERELRYHSHIDLHLTAFEVKRRFPTAENVQQAASYLVYGHASYLCYFDDRFRGTNVDIAVHRLRDEGIWDLAESFGVGLIVSYYAQENGTKLYFQTVRHVPYKESPPTQVERGIHLWLTDDARSTLRKAYVKHIQRIQANLD